MSGNLPPPSLPQPTPPAQPIPEPTRTVPWWRRTWALVLGAVLVGLVVIGAIFGGEDSADTVTSSGTEQAPTFSSATSSSSDQPVATTSAAPTTIVSTTTSSTSSTTLAPTTVVPPVVEDARSRLGTLIVADPDPARTPYDRDDYQPGGWADFDGDCITTRHDVLIRESLVPVTMTPDGCRVEFGEWRDPFTGDLLITEAEATIDHHVPLAEAHRAGAWRWDSDTKVRFSNDLTPGALNVVGADVNQAKADSTPDTWVPPLKEHRCGYAVQWINVKARWSLTTTDPERTTLDELLDSCTPATTPDVVPFEAANVVTTTTPPTTSTTLPPPSAGPGEVVLVSCNARSEKVVISNPGGEPASLDGYLLHDEGRKHETPLGQWGPLAPSSNLTIVSGDEAVEASGQVVWKRQNVWNNDGDTANLVAADGTVQTTRC